MESGSRGEQDLLEVRVHLREQKEGEETPKVALYRLGRNGRPEERIAQVDDGVLRVPSDLPKRAPLVALGPDVEDPSTLDRSALLTYRAEDALRQWREAPQVELPRLRWIPWSPIFQCVTGSVRKCWFGPPLPTPIARPRSRRGPFPRSGVTERLTRGAGIIDFYFPPTVCKPLCTGVVEVWERTCCCDWWEIIPRIPELIPEIPDFPIPLPDPPFPEPRPGPIGPGPRQIARTRRLYEATVEPSRRVRMEPRVVRALEVLQGLEDPREIHAFVVERPYLLPVFCRCSSTKVGQTQVNLDGSFDLCYPRRWTRPGCTRTWYVKVRQYVGGTWLTVYDGEAARGYFSAGESIDVTTFHPMAETCTPPDDPPVDGHGQAFIMLQSIGDTDTHELHSPAQTTLSGVTGPGNSGLLDQAYASACPLGRTLKLLLWIDPQLEALGAEYYRFSIAATDGAGNVSGVPQRLSGSVSWRRWANGVWPPQPENVALGPVDPGTVGGEAGLVKIPYYGPTNRWLGNQFHYHLDTTAFANGRYVLMLEVFDAAGTRLRPNGATGAGSDTAFHYVHWDTPTTTSVVDFAQLLHVIHVNNTSCYADIEDLRKDGLASLEECQFKSGTASSQFSVGFRAFHVDGFKLSHSLTYQRGLNGTGTHGTGTLASGGTSNQPPSLAGGDPAESSQLTFAHMLGDDGDGPEHQKCTFSLDLHVHAKHTNGEGRIHAYDAHDDASFALEILP